MRWWPPGVWCQVHGCGLPEVSDADLAKISAHLTPEVREVLSVAGALAACRTPRGTALERVAGQLAALRAAVDEHAAWAVS
jgi:argininosuccinate lyase